MARAMDSAEFRARQERLGWSNLELAERAGVRAYHMVSRYRTGAAPIPGTLAAWLRLAAHVGAARVDRSLRSEEAA